jgi:hypothetical protein
VILSQAIIAVAPIRALPGGVSPWPRLQAGAPLIGWTPSASTRRRVGASPFVLRWTGSLPLAATCCRAAVPAIFTPGC